GSLGKVDRQVRKSLAEDLMDDQRDRAAHGDEECGGAQCAPAADPNSRTHQRYRRGYGEQDRLEHEAELRHAEVVLRLERREADQETAHEADAAQADDQGGLATSP